MAPYFIGIDIGTQGARIVLLNSLGEIMSTEENVFLLDDSSREEQSPELWWDVCLKSLINLTAKSRDLIDLKDIQAIAVTSTSGTVIPLDGNNKPLHNAIMYSDKRSVEQAKTATAAAQQYHSKGYTSFNFSSGLAKMLWFGDVYPEKTAQIARWVHAADYITGMLSNRWGITDYTNAFKSGFDVSSYKWPAYLYEKLPLKQGWLPEVLPSGTIIGTISADTSRKTGLPESIKVAVGITDGCASQIASGAINPGDWNTTIGTTMVIKGVTEKEVIDPFGRIYSHRHPAGYWMPGGASNTGADWVSTEFGDNLTELNSEASKLIPTGHISFPLRQQGERFPIICPEATGFEPAGLSEAERFTANMEGVAYLERYAYELIQHLSGEKVNAVYTAGGASNSDTWLTIRANVMNKPIYKMKYVSGAVGAAILAASNTSYNTLAEAVSELTTVDKEVHPENSLAKKYNDNYLRFLEIMKQKGYIKEEFDA